MMCLRLEILLKGFFRLGIWMNDSGGFVWNFGDGFSIEHLR